MKRTEPLVFTVRFLVFDHEHYQLLLNLLFTRLQAHLHEAHQTKDNILYMIQTAQQAFNEGKKRFQFSLTLQALLIRRGTKASSKNYVSLRSLII